MTVNAQFLKTVLVLGLSASGCWTSRLTDEAARNLIRKSEWFAPRPVEFALSREEVEAGADAGYWTWQREKGAVSYSVFQLTERGMTIFESEGRDTVGGRTEFSLPVLKTRAALGRCIVRVIRASASEIAFDWQWDLSALPENLAAVLLNPERAATLPLHRDR